MYRTRNISLVIAFVLTIFILGVVAGRFLLGEWKPVGDGASIMHTRTGEVRPIGSFSSSKLIPMRFRGEWKPVDPSETETETITIMAFMMSFRINSPERGFTASYKCEVVEAKDNWVILRAIRKELEHTREIILETVSDDSILCDKITYTRVNATDEAPE